MYYGPIIGLQYNPITISQHGLFQYAQYLRTGQIQARERVLTSAAWLMENYQPTGAGAAGWYYTFDLDFYQIKAPWLSAMAQGEAISLLLRAHSIQQNPAWLEVARMAGRTFLDAITDGGVCATFEDGTLSLEEFPSAPPCHVLNGSIFAIFGLYDYLQVFDDPALTHRFQAALQGLRQNLHRYDTGYWSRYDLYPIPRLASHTYQRVHIQLLQILNQITGGDECRILAAKWRHDYYHPWFNLRWILHKIYEKINLARRRNHQQPL
ncbi:D-glucuronyl C5-epimerase family protein [candidate division KSB1 bacterium]|nr:D-glucuronyl C5-epimerase family protein [candidate division KSB1 bacterium]